jgi:putative DNA primase/helicase
MRSGQQHNTGNARLIIKPVKWYKQTQINWLEKGRIAMGKVTLIAGDPGLGKSFMTLELCARVSRGECGSADINHLPQAVILSAEDDAGDTIRPRLVDMGANLSRVHIIDGVAKTKDESADDRCDLTQLDRDMDLLVKGIRDLGGVTLIVIDPISAYMGKADSHNNAEVRAVLADLAQLASLTGAAVVCVTHLNKDTGGKRAVYRAMGSLAFTAAARAVHLVTKHPGKGELDGFKRVVSMVKNNIGPPMPARVYVIDNGVLVWLDEEIEMSSDELDTGATGVPGVGSLETGINALDEARAFLEDRLSGGAVAGTELYEQANANGISKGTLNRAKDELRVKSIRNGKTWQWTLNPGTLDHDHEPTALDDNGYM